MLGAVGVVLNEVEDVGVIGVEEADVVAAALLDGGVEAALGLAGAPEPEVAAVQHGPQVLPVGRLVQHLTPLAAHLQPGDRYYYSSLDLFMLWFQFLNSNILVALGSHVTGPCVRCKSSKSGNQIIPIFL